MSKLNLTTVGIVAAAAFVGYEFFIKPKTPASAPAIPGTGVAVPVYNPATAANPLNVITAAAPQLTTIITKLFTPSNSNNSSAAQAAAAQNAAFTPTDSYNNAAPDTSSIFSPGANITNMANYTPNPIPNEVSASGGASYAPGAYDNTPYNNEFMDYGSMGSVHMMAGILDEEIG